MISKRIPLTLALAGLLLLENSLLAQGEGPIGTLGFDGKSTRFPSGLSASNFRARLSPANEVPSLDGSIGSARANISVIRGGTESDPINFVEFQVDYTFTVAARITGMHIHSGEAGTNGPIVVDSGLPGGAFDVVPNRPGTIRALVRDSRWAAEIERNPSAFYINIHTAANPGGAMRGQLVAAKQIIAGADMRTGNEIPQVPQPGLATGMAIATITRDANGVIDTAEIRFLVKYAFPAATFLGQQNITGLHIHAGTASVNGPVILDSGINAASGLQVDPSGNGSIDVRNELVLNDDRRRALEAMATSSGAYYMNIHTNGFPAGFARGQVRPTDRLIIGVKMSRAGAEEAADASYIADVVRGKQGYIEFGLSSFALLHRNFTADTKFTGLHIHEGGPTVNGPVRIDSGLSSATAISGDGAPGFIGLSNVIPTTDAVTLAAVQDMAANLRDQGYYMNLHTVLLPGGAIRGQMGAGGVVATSDFNRVDDVVNSVSGERTIAPGARITISGSFLVAPGGQNADVEGAFFGNSLNGASVEIDGARCSIISVDTTSISAVVPFSVAAGSRKLTVKLINGDVASKAVDVTISRYAPAIVPLSDGPYVVIEGRGVASAANPVRSGDRLTVYAAGLGQTRPALFDGEPAPSEADGLAFTDTVTATLGGQNARVVNSYALPNYVGYYVVAVEVPTGIGAGSQPFQLRIGGTASSPVSIPVGSR